jgi:hypothetical protein
MMGRLKRGQEQLFYSFCLDEAVPDDHAVAGLPPYSIYRGFTANLRPITRFAAGPPCQSALKIDR